MPLALKAPAKLLKVVNITIVGNSQVTGTVQVGVSITHCCLTQFRGFRFLS